MTKNTPPPADNDQDCLFKSPANGDFRFDSDTAAVFDDMISRSIPLYDEIQRMSGEIAADFARPQTSLFDLGCATGTSLAELDLVIDPAVRFVGVDGSPQMLEKARQSWLSAPRLGRSI